MPSTPIATVVRHVLVDRKRVPTRAERRPVLKPAFAPQHGFHVDRGHKGITLPGDCFLEGV